MKSFRSSESEPPKIDFLKLQGMSSEDSEPPPIINFDRYSEDTESSRSYYSQPPKIDFSILEGMSSEDSEPPPVINFPLYSNSIDSEESAEKYLESRKSPIQSPKVFII